MQKRYVVGKCKCSEERHIGFDGCEEEVKDVCLCGCRVQVGTVSKLQDFLICIREDLVDVFCLASVLLSRQVMTDLPSFSG